MNKLRILLIEDSPQDEALLLRTLQKAGLQFEHSRVSTIPELEHALTESWDLALSDYHLRGFSAEEVLKKIKSNQEDLPVIVVSGAVNEENAVDLMRAGASDFVRKDNSSRLVPAIERELRDVADRKARWAAEELLHSNEELTKGIIESSDDGIFVLDLDGQILSASPAALKARAPDVALKLLGTPWAELWPQPEDAGAARDAVTSACTGSPGRLNARLISFDGALHWFGISVNAIRGKNNKIERLLVIERDITNERRTLEDLVRQSEQLSAQAKDLKAALANAESANKMKTAFLANMSHEIRTPIGAMMGFSELIAGDEVSREDRLSFFAVIKRNGEALLRIISDILDLSKVESGHLQIEKSDVPVKTLISDIIASNQLQAQEKSIQLVCVYNSTAPSVICSDDTRLRQILGNLIANAVKFTDSGSITISVSSENTDNQQTVLFSVKDTGIGISEEDQQKLFRSFAQADDSASRRFGGTGLGLALSKRLAQALGGDVRIGFSAPGQGSEFIASVRNMKDEKHSEMASTNANSKIEMGRLKGAKILLADDSLDNQLLVRRILENNQVQIATVSSGGEAVKSALSGDFDLVLMDIQMPGMDGRTALLKLREQGYKKPIIAITAHAMKEDRQFGLKSGFNDYVTKPIEFQELVQAISKALS